MATRETAQGLAGLGRNGDSTLVHMQPEEVQGLQALAQANGTSLTINPATGLPEAFSLGGFFKSLLPTLAGVGVGAAGGPLMAGIAAGALTGAVTNKKDPLMGAVMGGMGGYGGFGLQGNLAKMGISDAATNIAANPEGFANAQMGNAMTEAGITGGLDQGAALTGVDPAVMAKGFQSGVNVQDPAFLDAVKYAQGNPAPSFTQNLQTTGQNFADIATMKPGAFEAFKTAGGSGMQLGMPFAGAALGGLEPSDLGYGTNLAQNDTRGKYDPYASLDLSGDTGLRLYAQGGPVSFANGGSMRGGDRAALTGGGAGAMEGSSLLPIDVADINTRLGYDPSALSGSGPSGIYGMMGAQRNTMPQVEVPKLGLFASNDQIESARTAYEKQLAAAMAGRSGMGSIPNAGYVGMGGLNRGYTGIGGANSNSAPMGMSTAFNRTAPTAQTASTAETALSRLNLNKDYAQGGTIQGGGLQGLYGSMDDTQPTPTLSRSGYGLGRMQSMASGGESVYAKGGRLREGGFVVPADVVSHLGNGSTDAGLKLLAAKYNAEPIKGAGDGMSDSIPTTIDGKQKARVADGEAFISPEVVAKHGGTKRFYTMMDNIRKERTGSTRQGKQIKAAKHLPK